MIHQLSAVDPRAKIGKNVTIDPFSTISSDVEIGDGTWVGSNVTIMDGARIGKNCKEKILWLLSGIILPLENV